jgi:hypothetical protein
MKVRLSIYCFVVVVALVAAQAGSAFGATKAIAWTQKAPLSSPSARAHASTAYDAAHGETVLFGGWDGSSVLGDTWTWDGQDWTLRHPANAPSPRASASMAYDSTHGSVILFGGQVTGLLQTEGPRGVGEGSFLRDTWRWNGSNWKRLAPARRPPARAGDGSLSDDPAIGGLLLFGGFALNTFYGDTWKWTGSNWRHLHPPTLQSPRATGLAYSVRLGQVVAFGGFDEFSLLDETWLFNGSDWIQANPTTVPVARATQAMSALGKNVVIFGGYGGTYSLDDTWIYDGTDWIPGPANGPGARSASGQMSYDTVHHKAVLFGGRIDEVNSFYGGTWTLG